MSVIELLSRIPDEMWHVRDLLSSASSWIEKAIELIDCGGDRRHLEEGKEIVDRAHSAVDLLIEALE